MRKEVTWRQKPKVDVGAYKDKRYERLPEEMGENLNWNKRKQIIIGMGFNIDEIVNGFIMRIQFFTSNPIQY